MRKQTNLAEVKLTALALLSTEINETPYSPMIVKHPFTDTGVSAIPDGKGGVEVIDLTEDDAQLRWRQSDGGKYVAHGNYSPDYLVSKENFAVRAGLVDDDKLLTKEEAEELFKCAAFARDNCESLTYEQDRGLMELMEKLQTAYPHLKDNPPTFDDGENPILNM